MKKIRFLKTGIECRLVGRDETYYYFLVAHGLKEKILKTDSGYEIIEDNMITGKEALIALANGEGVQYISLNDPNTPPRWTTIKAMRDYNLDSFLNPNTDFQFRLKPRTITINGIDVEIPKELRVDPITGTVGLVYSDNDKAKQVVEALRSIFATA